LRFDFAAKNPLTHSELSHIETTLNAYIQGDYTVTTEELSYPDAIARGAKAFFDEKYGEFVRLVTCVGTELTSMELCGGTHVSSTGQIGAFKIISQESVASGIRRIIAVTGTKVADYGTQKDTELLGISLMLDCQVKQIPEKLEKVMKEYEGLKSAYTSMQTQIVKQYLEKSEIRNQKSDLLDVVIFVEDAMDIERKVIINEARQLFADKHWCIYNSLGSFALGSYTNTAKILANELGVKGGGNEMLVQGKDEGVLKIF
jgi:alanyl-tRNA synthetase